MQKLGVGMLEISLDQVPEYLRDGEYFKNLNEGDDDGRFSVPADVLKSDTTIKGVDDLRHLLRSLQYWIAMSEILKTAIVEFLLSKKFTDSTREMLREFQVAFPFLRIVRMILGGVADNRATKFSPLALVQHVLKRHPCSMKIVTHLMEHDSAQNPDDEKVQLFLKSYSVECVAEEGRLDMLMYLNEHNIHSTSLCYYSAKNGHLDCLKYLVDEGSHLREKTSLIAASNGHVHILKFLFDHNLPFDGDCSQAAATKGQLPVLKYLREIGAIFDIYCCRYAAENGHLACLQFLHSIGRPWGVHVPSYAARYGHLDCLRFAHENGCVWDAETCCYAAAGGELECLKYARENGCPWEISVCTSAAAGGHLHCLQYAHNNRCPWDATTCSSAAAGGHLACLRFAHEKGCRWDNSTTRCAVNHLQCLIYALDNRCPYSRSIAVSAFQANQNESGFYILEHCVCLNSDIYTCAAEKGRLDILEACMSAGIPWHEQTCAAAARAGHKHCLEFALSNGAPPVGDLTLRNRKPLGNKYVEALDRAMNEFTL